MNSDNGLLAKRIFQGDEEAFKILYEEFFHALLAIACKYVESEVAKDIVQESFLRLWENREAVLDGKEKSYLFTIAYRLIIDQVRHIRRYTTDDTLQHRPDEGNRGYSGAGEVVQRYLDQLPEIQRTLILLRDYEGYSYQEMADMTSLSVAQVKVYIFRARMALKQQIGTIRNLL